MPTKSSVLSGKGLFLLVIDGERRVIPLSGQGLVRTQLSPKQLKSNIGNLLVRNDGSAWKITGVECFRYFGKNVFDAVLNLLTDTMKIDLDLVETDMDISALKSVVSSYIETDIETWRDGDYDRMREMIAGSSTVNEVFVAIGVESDDDCLSVF